MKNLNYERYLTKSNLLKNLNKNNQERIINQKKAIEAKSKKNNQKNLVKNESKENILGLAIRSKLFENCVNKNILPIVNKKLENITNSTLFYKSNNLNKAGIKNVKIFKKIKKKIYQKNSRISFNSFDQDSKITKKYQKKIKKKQTIQLISNDFNVNDYVSISNYKEKFEYDGRKSYRIRESILDVDKNKVKDKGKLSHYMRQIFNHLIKKEVKNIFKL